MAQHHRHNYHVQILEMMVGVNIGREQLELIAHRTIKDADEDIDDAIDFEEFKKVLQKFKSLNHS